MKLHTTHYISGRTIAALTTVVSILFITITWVALFAFAADNPGRVPTPALFAGGALTTLLAMVPMAIANMMSAQIETALNTRELVRQGMARPQAEPALTAGSFTAD